VKTPQEFADITDLEFADNKSLFAALARRDSLELAKLLAPLSGEPVRQRILDALSRRRREEVEADLDGLQVDAAEARQIGATLIDEVRKLMLEARAS
jgi:flagellar motor switch protein FliG